MADEYIVEVIGGATITRMHESPSSDAVVPIVDMRQLKLALLAAGKLAIVEASIDAMDEHARAAAQIEWTSTSAVRRDHPTVALIAAAGMSESEIDALFAAAAAIE